MIVWLSLVVLLLGVKFAYKPVIRATYSLHKFNAKTGVFTSTTAYSRYGEMKSSGNETSNAEIPREIESLESEDTKYVSGMGDTQACVPQTFGYSSKEGEAVFPPYTYPTCESLLTESPPKLYLNTDSGTFSMSCNSSSSMYYIKNPPHLHPDGQYTFTDLADKWKKHKATSGEMQLEDSEFVYGSCGEEFTEAVTLPRVNVTAYMRTKKIMTEKGYAGRPLSVLLLTIDSFSRKHFYRKLTETVKLLNKLRDSGEFGVYDFKLNNIQGGNSIDNMITIFANFTPRPLDDPPYEDRLGATSLWHILKSNGYVTLLGVEMCDIAFPSTIGRRIETDHLIRNFYCADNKLFTRGISKDYQEQRCIGAHMSHFFLLNYTLSFMQTYQGLNQFISLHIDTAHEATGQHAATLDPDLTDFLLKYATWSQRNGHDLVVFLQADHGMRYGDWFKDAAALQESKLPAFFIIATKTLLERIPGSEEVLWVNTFRLTSKPDLRASILGLSLLPYGENYPVHSESYLSHSIDLFREESPLNRTCESAGIPPWYCSCMLFEPIDMSGGSSDSSDSLSQLVYSVAEYSLYIMNRETHSSPSLPSALLCEKLTLGGISKPSGLNIGRSLELIRVEVYVKQHKQVKFEVLAVVGAVMGADLLRLEDDRYELFPFVHNGYQVNVRVVGIDRKDKYAGECEAVANNQHIKAAFCICKDLDGLRKEAPGLWEISH